MARLRGAGPQTAVVVLALIAAVAGTALAGPVGITAKKDKVTKREKKRMRKVADKRIAKAEPELNVNSAKSADTASTANTATSADRAGSANVAFSAGFADAAGSAAKAENVLSAAVNPNGTLARAGQPNTTSARIDNPGQYEVDFGRNVSNCIWVAGISSVTDPTTDGQAQVGPRTGNIDAIFVLTTDSGGTIANKPFHAVVAC